MEGDGMTASEKVDKLYTDVAVLAAIQGEMSKRLDDGMRSIEILNHNSTAAKVTMARLEANVDRNSVLITDAKNDLSGNFKMWLIVLGLFLTTITFIITYFKP